MAFDYLDYKNRIPLDKCVVEIPNYSPVSIKYEKFWIHTMKRKQIEGHWVEHNNEWKWIPGVIVQYCNLFKIERKSSSGSAKGKVIGKPDLRDIEWIKGYIYSVARGFSGFEDDDNYSSHRVLLSEDRDELISFLPDNVRKTLYRKDGTLKEYTDPLPYLYKYFDRSLGKPLFHNPAKNLVEIGARNYGKDLREDTIVYTEHGTKEIKDLKVGEKIYDNNGELTTVTNKFSFTDQLQYEVTLQDGRKIYCGEGHRWGVYHRGKYKVVDLKYILNTKYKTKRINGYSEYNFRIPLTKPINFKEVDTGIDSYLLGLWLGDGTSRETQFTNIDSEIVDYLKKFCLENKLELSNNGITYRIKGGKSKNFVLDYLRNNNLILNKHIPKIFFTASKKQRLELLQGLLDTDGSISKNGEIEFSNKNEKLIDDVMLLCHSLGIKCYKRKRKTSCTYKGEIKECESFRLLIHTSEKVFKLKRKLDRITEARSKKAATNRESVAIVDIKPTEIRPSYCITVDNNSHLFLAGDFIVTHNTMFSANICAHNFLTDGVTDFDEWFQNSIKPKDSRVIYTTQTLIGAIDAKYVNNLTKHLKVGLDNLVGGGQVGGINYPPPLSKQYMGSFTVGKDIIARYQEKVGGKWEWKGSGSGFSMRSFKDNPFAANGLRYGLGLIDEVGFHNNLLETLGQLHECTTVDGEKYGTIWMTGTGGDMESGATEQVMKIFYDPDTNDCLSFDDIFENKGKIGFFVPAWMTLSEYRDEYGNINKELALKKLLKEREIAKKAKSKAPYYSLLQMKPLKPSEAFLVLEGNIFPVGELKEHLADLESSERLKDLGTVGWMYRDSEGKAVFKPDPDLIPSTYPTRESATDKGAVVIWEQPIPNPPYGLYVAGIDPYDQDKAENSVSFGSIFIYKRFIMEEGQTTHLPVAEYTGRPEFANDFYEQCRRLLEYYNAKALYENQNNGLKRYFETKFCTYLLHQQPNIIKSISPSSNVNRQYGIHMTSAIKDEIEIMLRDWLKTEISPGVQRLTQIYSIPLLKELISYNKDGNFDRVIAFGLCILQDTEMHRIRVNESKQEKVLDNFFDRKLFSNQSNKKSNLTYEELISRLNSN